jgi:hypothetical protein
MSLKDSVAAGHKIIHDANLQDLARIIGCRMSEASAVLQKNLAVATLTKPATLVSRQKTIERLRTTKESLNWNDLFDRAAKAEAELVPFFDDNDKDSLENDAIAQLSFQDDFLKPLNQVPWMILVITLFKVWVVPTMTLLTPIMAWILPYILLRFVYALPIDQAEYGQILQGMWAGNMGPVDQAPDYFSPRSIFQFILFSFSFAQSMIQPIQNAMHLNKTDKVIFGLGKKLVELRDIIRQLRASTDAKLTDVLEDLDDTDYRRAFLLAKEQPERLHMAFRDLAALEIMWRMASHEALQPIGFNPNVLAAEDMVDISLEAPIASSIELTAATQPHAIITGPNGGGKSSFLRSVLQTVMIGHAYGFAPAKRALIPRFAWIASGLQLRDTPGLYSLFETEVKFAADCIRSAKRAGPGLVLFDELFHSTNPPDGARSSELFLKQLWAVDSGAFSIISTHVFPLVEEAPQNVQALCCPASERLDGSIRFSFKAEPGICTVSSVQTVWQKYGLTGALIAAPPSLQEKEKHAP